MLALMLGPKALVYETGCPATPLQQFTMISLPATHCLPTTLPVLNRLLQQTMPMQHWKRDWLQRTMN